MAVTLASFMVPKGKNTFFLIEDKYIRGGLRVAVDATDRDGINPINKKAGMIVIQQDDYKLYQLQDDLKTYKEVKLGGVDKIRQTLVYTTQTLAPKSVESFTLPMGKSNLIIDLSVDFGPCTIKAFGTSACEESNPYTFVATDVHLADDGSSILSDGTVTYGRRYSIVSNTEDTPTNDIFFKLQNTSVGSTAFTLTVTFLPLE